MAAIAKLARILATIVPAFFIREKPTSSRRKPPCMNSTSTAAITTHSVSSWLLRVAPDSRRFSILSSTGAVFSAASVGTTPIRSIQQLAFTRFRAIGGDVRPRQHSRRPPPRPHWPGVQDSAGALVRRYKRRIACRRALAGMIGAVQSPNDHRRFLVISADDYGYWPSYNEGILAAVEAGAIDSVSVMTERKYCDPAPLLELGVEVGLHIEFEGRWGPRSAGPARNSL